MESLVLFAKVPVLGAVKTRLAKGIGDEKALAWYQMFLQETVDLLQSWQRAKDAAAPRRARVYLASRTDLANPPWGELEVWFQEGEDLGERMRNCMVRELETGAEKVCIIGADTPTLPLHLLEQSFRALEWHDAVLGPTFDGGYWTVGARHQAPDIFTDVSWSSSQVMPETLTHLERAGVNFSLLPFWYDVDSADDLYYLQWHSLALRMQKKRTGTRLDAQLTALLPGHQ